MARIAGVDIPNDKRVVVSLTYVYGIGRTTASNILKKVGISEDIRVKDLSEEQMNLIRQEVDGIKVEGDLRRAYKDKRAYTQRTSSHSSR